MANRFARKSGNWNASDVWSDTPTGTAGAEFIPVSGDVAMSNSFAVTVNVDATCAEVRNDTTGGATAGGGFTLASGVTLTANVYAGSAQCMTYGGAAPNTVTIVGNIVGGTGGFAYGIIVSSTGTVNITGNVTGGSFSSGYGVYLNAASILNITGSVFGGNGTGVFSGSANSAVTVNGNVTAAAARGIENQSTGSVTVNGSVYADVVRGINNVSNGQVIITGTIAASATASGLVNAGTTEARVTGPLTVAVQAIPAIDGRWRFNSSMTSTYMEVYNHDGVKKTLYTTTYTAIGGLPATTNVRSGTVFGPVNELTGTLAVPPAASVSYGVPVDNTTGTAAITAADIRTAIGLASANLDTQLSAIPTTGLTAQQVWEYATRTLTAGSGITAQDVWEYATRELTSSAGATAEDVWTYATRSLTEAPDLPTVEEIAAEVRTELTPELSRVANCATVESTGDQLAGLL